ncbi:phosphate/phosphite/phosphonate ABC transporter substrate-binding protein [Desulfobotulus sp. H1]|uniref:Phosphate/phosphite/phosphonate ABC transporter substrate-binding protein n=1 Tax=Desulfobotulus pelophilus TaxID=2823377 RepID=A0ABT3NA54_9BACT|nr:hypothetical protein [Desulfobotulus pelophilus]MCW7754338.1 phosphate/phosphite/phosphonate ABC transporter substrate-binding protein [Desulfobotulus pelophilus]
MLKSNQAKILITLTCISILALAGGLLLVKNRPDETLLFGRNPDLPTLTFYTSDLATTPQLPFWSALKKGELLENCNIRVELWKNLDDLRGIMLAGKGDLWLGDTEGFARAQSAGAPVRLLLISGWRKFYLVSRNSKIHGLDDIKGTQLAFTPPGTPAVSLIRSIQKEDRQAIIFASHEPRQLALMLLDGRLDTALLPEPLLSSLIAKDKTIRIVENIEDYYGRKTGGPGRIPLAGIAVNAKTAAAYPHLVQSILDTLIREGEKLTMDADAAMEALDALPTMFTGFIPKEMIAASLERDVVLVKTALDAEKEIRSYLSILMPGFLETLKNRNDFFWEPM